MHKNVDLPVYYFGTPVLLTSTLNEDGSTNIAPSSSIWWLAKSCMIGLDGSSKTTENLVRTRHCVVNLASANEVDAVHSLARATGSEIVPMHKQNLGYEFVKDKASLSGLTLEPSNTVGSLRIVECPIQLEAKVVEVHKLTSAHGLISAFELKIQACHIEQRLLKGPTKQYVDADLWNPLIMNFGQYYSTDNAVHPHKVESEILEKYRTE